MKRVVTVCIAAAAALSGAPALAGLASSLETERGWYRAGDVVVGRATYSSGAHPGDGRPLHAFLIEASATASVPDAPGAHLGPLRTRGSDGARRELSIRFVVPDVPPGRYVIEVCARPCGVDDGSSFTSRGILIGDSVAEARLGHELRAAERRAERLERRLDEERASVVPEESMSAAPPVRPSAVEGSTGLLPLLAGVVAGLLVGLVVRRRPRVIALVPFDPLAPPTPRRSSRRLR